MELFKFRGLPEDLLGNVEMPGEALWIPTGV